MQGEGKSVGFPLFHFEFLLESLNPTGGIHDFLRSGKERMAVGANFYGHIAFCRASFISGPANAGDCRFVIFRMQCGFHILLQSRVQKSRGLSLSTLIVSDRSIEFPGRSSFFYTECPETDLFKYALRTNSLDFYVRSASLPGAPLVAGRLAGHPVAGHASAQIDPPP